MRQGAITPRAEGKSWRRKKRHRERWVREENEKESKREQEREGPQHALRVAGSSGSELRSKRSAFATLATFLFYEIAEVFLETIDRLVTPGLDTVFFFSLQHPIAIGPVNQGISAGESWNGGVDASVLDGGWWNQLQEAHLGTCFLLLKFLRCSRDHDIVQELCKFAVLISRWNRLDLVFRRTLTCYNNAEKNNVKIIEELIRKSFHKIFASCGISFLHLNISSFTFGVDLLTMFYANVLKAIQFSAFDIYIASSPCENISGLLYWLNTMMHSSK